MTTLEDPRSAELPRWDVTDVFPSLGSREYAAARESVSAGITRLTALYDEHDVRGGTELDVDDAAVAAFDEVIGATNELLDRLRVVGAFTSSFVTTDARDDEAQAELSAMQAEQAELSRLRGRFDAWVASLGPDALVARSTVAADHAFPLERAALRASHQMTEAEEGLAADLQLTGASAWSRLYRDVTARLTATVRDDDGTEQTMPFSAVRGMAFDPDGERRRRAYEAELEACRSVAVPVAAALNGIKGEAITLNRRRGWADGLEPALAANNVDRATLDAMQEAVVASFPDFRRYLKAKATLLGRSGGLPWYDLFGPVGGEHAPRYAWDEATDAVQSSFGGYSERLQGLARRALEEQWVDAEPRDGKGSGAFCMSLDGDRSLVLLNFDGGFRSVQTLAHELGHAYHNVNLADRTPYQRQTPMALAETASIFCETILVERGLASVTHPQQRLALLESDLQGTCQLVVDIHSRFLFERSVYEAREKRAVSVAELDQLMLDAQDQTYGDGLDAELRHPCMWIVKPHYYGTAFYNWPYTFGFLFGVGLYARYLEDPEQFRAGYDDLLSATGLGDAASLAGRFGIDIHDTGFWTASLDVVRARIHEFETLVAG